MLMRLAQKSGVFILPNFLDAATCADIRQQMEQAPSKPMTIYNPTTQQSGVLQDNFRQTSRCQVSPRLRSLMKSRLESIQDQLEQHFKLTFTSIEKPRFFIYRLGHFFGLHNDDAFGRKVNITIFLNDQVNSNKEVLGDSTSYTGGSLTLYGLLDKPGWRERGIPMTGKTGMLVAYSALLMHEVTPITQGERFAIVTHCRGS